MILSFALPDYEQQLSQKQFQYKLDGFDKKWIKTSQTEVHYTNLDPGTYTLRVAAINNSSNQSGDITDKEISMQLTISAPWYATWWAFLLYIISFI